MPACFPVTRCLQSHIRLQYEFKLFFGDARPVVPEVDTVRLPSGTALADVLYAAGNLIAR